MQNVLHYFCCFTLLAPWSKVICTTLAVPIITNVPNKLFLKGSHIYHILNVAKYFYSYFLWSILSNNNTTPV